MADAQSDSKSILDHVKTAAELVQALFTIGAFIAAAWWFHAQNFTKQEIRIDQHVSQRPFQGTPDIALLVVDIRVTNVGKVPVNLDRGVLRVSSLNPEPSVSLKPINLYDMTLEPGESDYALFQTIKVPTSVKTLELHASYPVPNGSLSWNSYNVSDINAATPAK